MKPIFFALGLALLTSCLPEVSEYSLSHHVFQYDSHKSHRDLLRKVARFSDQEFLDWEEAQGHESFAGAYLKLMGQLAQAHKPRRVAGNGSQAS